MFRNLRRVRRALLPAALGLVATAYVSADTPALIPPAFPQVDIFDPNRAPIIIIKVGIHRLVLIPKSSGSSTSFSAASIEQQANNQSLSAVIAAKTPGVAASSSGEIHVRGSHGQYTYYLDGAPLPVSVSGSFEDLINPKNIQSLNVYTGGFPAFYGGNIAAIFDVTAKAGEDGPPHGFAQQVVQGYSTYDTTLQAGGGVQRFSYFLSGVRDFTNRQLDPVTQDPIHDDGNEAVGFGKFDYQAGKSDLIILDTAHTDGYFQIPDTQQQLANNVDDTQKESGNVVNLIWKHSPGADRSVLALYTHESNLRYIPSGGDLIGATPDNPLASADENRTSNYYGLRFDYSHPLPERHKLGFGADLETVTGTEHFVLENSTGMSSPTIITDDEKISGNDRGYYIQDDWNPGRFTINYGARYDIHKTDTLTQQMSPRFNLRYALDGHDTFHAYYDRLFQPAAVEDIRKLDTTAAPFKPERDDFYETGYEHTRAGYTESFSTYYKVEQDVIDENTIAGTIIPEPFNVQRGYVRGLEWAVDGPVGPTVSFYANYARSWAKSEGNFTGGFIPIAAPPSWFYDDHDQTNTASFGLSYNKNGTFADLDSEYGSGFPFGQDAQGDVNYIRVDPHLIFNLAVGANIKSSSLTFTVINLLNHPYIITEGGVFSEQQWGQDRTFGVKYTLNF